MANYRHSPGIHAIVGFQIIQNPTRAPRPGRQSPPGIARTDLSRIARRVENAMGSVAKVVIPIGINVLSRKSRRTIAARDDRGNRLKRVIIQLCLSLRLG